MHEKYFATRALTFFFGERNGKKQKTEIGKKAAQGGNEIGREAQRSGIARWWCPSFLAQQQLVVLSPSFRAKQQAAAEENGFISIGVIIFSYIR